MYELLEYVDDAYIDIVFKIIFFGKSFALTSETSYPIASAIFNCLISFPSSHASRMFPSLVNLFSRWGRGT